MMKKRRKTKKQKHLLLPLLLAAALTLAARYLPGTGQASWDLEDVPAYDGEPYVVLLDGQPDFDKDDLTTEPFEEYSPLDALGRCGPAYANVCRETMPTEERGAIGMVKPSGWHTVKYDCVDGKYLYNRCHLLGYQLTGENANEENLITGTRSMNVDGMLPFEDQVADYVQETGNHVLYRVTPVFRGTDLVAEGVQMEAFSVEDQGAGVCFNVYVYNAQPGVTIDYATGDSCLTEEETPAEEPSSLPDTAPEDPPSAGEEPEEAPGAEGYVLNTRSRRFHLPACSGAADIQPQNRDVWTGSREDLLAQEYTPCGQCRP